MQHASNTGWTAGANYLDITAGGAGGLDKKNSDMKLFELWVGTSQAMHGESEKRRHACIAVQMPDKANVRKNHHSCVPSATCDS